MCGEMNSPDLAVSVCLSVCLVILLLFFGAVVCICNNKRRCHMLLCTRHVYLVVHSSPRVDIVVCPLK